MVVNAKPANKSASHSLLT